MAGEMCCALYARMWSSKVSETVGRGETYQETRVAIHVTRKTREVRCNVRSGQQVHVAVSVWQTTATPQQQQVQGRQVAISSSNMRWVIRMVVEEVGTVADVGHGH
jgi:hypothetical protein